MEKILSLVRRCVEDYDMIQPGDRVAVGVSGGKDSLVTLAALAKLSQFYPKSFTVEAFTLNMGPVEGGPSMDFGPVAAYCESIGVPFTLISSEISHIIFDLRKEKNPSTRSPWATILTTRWRPSSFPSSMRAASPASSLSPT